MVNQSLGPCDGGNVELGPIIHVLPPPIPKLKIELKGRVPTGRIERHSFLVCFDGFLPLAIDIGKASTILIDGR